MPVLKIVFIVLAALLILIAGAFYIALSDTIKNVSDQPVFASLLNRPLTLKRTGIVYRYDKGSFIFFPQVLTATEQPGFDKIYTLPAGTVITINALKTRKGAVAGFTNLFVLGTFTDLQGKKIPFEYGWNTVNSVEGETANNKLVAAIWQEDTDTLVSFKMPL